MFGTLRNKCLYSGKLICISLYAYVIYPVMMDKYHLQPTSFQAVASSHASGVKQVTIV